MTDIEYSRLLEMSPGRTEETSGSSGEDMWVTFRKSAMKYAPQADIFHDRFHLEEDLNEAVDKVRRAEHRALQNEGIETLKGSKQLWLFHLKNLSGIRQISIRGCNKWN
jgi:transposase